MSLDTRCILALVDDEGLRTEIEAALKPIVKTVVTAKNSFEAQGKLLNQKFDAVLLRVKTPLLSDPRGLFAWFQVNKDYKNIPWIVLGKDIENEEIVITHSHIKFVPTPNDMALVIKILSSMFFSPGADATKVDVNFINPLVNSVVEVLKTMARVELKRETPFIKQSGGANVSRGDISGVIAMNSNFFLGSLAICFEENLILKIYENMLGTKVTNISDDVKDAVSELTNIIFGNAKRDLNVIGHSIAPALPSVVTGKNHEIRHSVSGHCICIPFTSAHGKLIVECMVSLKR